MRGCRWLLVAVALALVAPAAAVAAGGSIAAARDAASTRAFIRSSIRYDVVSLQLQHAVAAAGRGYVREVTAGCGQGLAGVPKKLTVPQYRALSNIGVETILAVEIRTLAPTRALADRIDSTQEGLRFSNPAVQWRVHASAGAISALLALPVPDLCADVRALDASHDTSMTAAGRTFVNDGSDVFDDAAEPPQGILMRMRRYAPTAVTAGVKRIQSLQRELNRREPLAPFQSALLDALFGGMPPTGV